MYFQHFSCQPLRKPSVITINIGVVSTTQNESELIRMLKQGPGTKQSLRNMPQVSMNAYTINDTAHNEEMDDCPASSMDDTDNMSKTVIIVHFNISNHASFLLAQSKTVQLQKANSKILLIGSIPTTVVVEDMVYYDIMCSELSIPYLFIGRNRKISQLHQAIYKLCDLGIVNDHHDNKRRDSSTRPMKRLQRWLSKSISNSSEEM